MGGKRDVSGNKRYFKGKGKVLRGVQKLFLIFIKLSLSLQMAITSGGYSKNKEITGALKKRFPDPLFKKERLI